MPTGIYPRPSLEERFWDKVEKTDTCWLWTADLRPDGYGHFLYKGKNKYAHRAAYELIVGPIPEGLQIDHLCRVRHCVKPEHLEPVTQRENVLRGVGRTAINARKTHCKRGHELSGDNLYKRSRGSRECRTCIHMIGREWYKNKRIKVLDLKRLSDLD